MFAQLSLRYVILFFVKLYSKICLTNALISLGFSHCQDHLQADSIIKLHIVINLKIDQYGGKKNIAIIFLPKPAPNSLPHGCSTHNCNCRKEKKKKKHVDNSKALECLFPIINPSDLWPVTFKTDLLPAQSDDTQHGFMLAWQKGFQRDKNRHC